MIDDLAKELGAEDWPKGLYMIFAKEGDSRMGLSLIHI